MSRGFFHDIGSIYTVRARHQLRLRKAKNCKVIVWFARQEFLVRRLCLGIIASI